MGWGQDCDDGYVWVYYIPFTIIYWDENNCFYQSDLDVLQQFIDINSDNPDGYIDLMTPLTLGFQIWSDGRLIFLDLTYDPFHDYGYNITDFPESIGNLSSLEELNYERNCYGCNYSISSLPESIGNLINLKSLKLGYNEITTIPEDLWNLTNLEVLWLFDNQLTGEIPSEIGNLEDLDYLRLNNNQLSGEIPSEICNQGDSTPSIVSNNKLCPPYPECLSEDYVGYQDTSGL